MRRRMHKYLHMSYLALASDKQRSTDNKGVESVHEDYHTRSVTYLCHEIDWINDISERLGNLLTILGPPSVSKESFR
jgi:hypothetical protein